MKKQEKLDLILQGAKIGTYTQSKRKILWCWQTDSYYSSNLEVEDVYALLEEAGITIWDVGTGADQYVLGRYNDVGDYEIGNCRFITKKENAQERARRKESRQWELPF